jgi:hypothetical protein
MPEPIGEPIDGLHVSDNYEADDADDGQEENDGEDEDAENGKVEGLVSGKDFSG